MFLLRQCRQLGFLFVATVFQLLNFLHLPLKIDSQALNFVDELLILDFEFLFGLDSLLDVNLLLPNNLEIVGLLFVQIGYLVVQLLHFVACLVNLPLLFAQLLPQIVVLVAQEFIHVFCRNLDADI